MINLDLHSHLLKAARDLSEGVQWKQLKAYLENAKANFRPDEAAQILELFAQLKKWQNAPRTCQALPVTPPHTIRTDTSPPRPFSSRVNSPAIPQTAHPYVINPVCMRDPENPMILHDVPLQVEERDESDGTNYIAMPTCSMFGLDESVQIGQNVCIFFVLQGEEEQLCKECIVLPYGKGQGEMCVNLIFAKERPNNPRLSEAPAFLNDNTSTLRPFSTPVFSTTEEGKDYEATFESEEFGKYFDEKLINYSLRAGEVCHEALDSRPIHRFRFAIWVDWNARKRGYPPGP